MLSVQMQIFAAANRIGTTGTTVRTFIVAGTSSTATSSLAKAFVLARTARTCTVALSELCVAKVLAAALQVSIGTTLSKSRRCERNRKKLHT